ncbi:MULTISPECIES: hypothetical protein [Delftia]|uniref:hypothetical protein n=1 Tax=Delftia TaxID=80865 RepID=UPI0003607E5D|nr:MULTISPECIES: hypothetical protein [Delftia]SFB65088.1 hypothetical protein SAMN05444579_12171 [Delftia tsuruhatensis]
MLAIYTWINGERALVLVPGMRPKSPWYVVMESAAYLYDDPAYLARMCKKACEVLGLPSGRPHWVRVATIIHEGLPDLVAMPCEPPWEHQGREFGSLVVTLDGKEIAAQALTVPDTGAEYVPV